MNDYSAVQVNSKEENFSAALRETCKRGTEDDIRAMLLHINPNLEAQQSRPIHWIAESGNVHALTALLADERVDVDHVNGYQRTALHLAAKCGNHEVMRLLLEREINVNAADRQGRTAFHLAAEMPVQGDLTEGRFLMCLTLLLDRPELQVNRPDIYGRTALSRALRKSFKERVQTILQHRGDHPLNLDYCLVDGGKTTRDCILEKFPEFEQFMPQPLVEDISSWKPELRLLAALQKGMLEEFKSTLHNNANAIDIHHGEPYHATCLELACVMSGKEKFVETMLRAETHLSVKNRVSNLPILHIAVEKLNIPVLEILLADPKVDNNVTGLHQGNALHWLASKKYVGGDVDKCVTLLVQTGLLDVDGTDARGDTALHVAVRWENLNVALMLLALGASVNIRNQKKHAPLHVAALSGDKNAVVSLLKHGADINAQTGRGTPLFIAAQRRKQDIVLLLLQQGANIMSETRGEPPLQYIDPETLEMFFDSCIESNAKSSKNLGYMLVFKYNFFPPIKSHTDLLRCGIDDFSHYKTEMDALLMMSKMPEMKCLMKHPFILSILFLKWRHACKAFYLNIGLFSIFLLCLTLHVVFINSIPNSMNNAIGLNATILSSFDVFFTENDYVILNIMLWISLSFLLGREAVEIIIIKDMYFRNMGNILDLMIIVPTLIVCIGKPTSPLTQHAASIVILLAWIEFLLLIGRLPNVSVQLEMLKKVSVTFLKFGLCYIPLIIAFALSFNILFSGKHKIGDKSTYNGGLWNKTSNSLIFVFETFIMFTGEIGAKDLPLSNTPGTSHFILILFVFLVALALLNLLNGLAVSDTKEIIDDAQTLSLIARTKLVHQMETMVERYQNKNYLHSVIKKFCFFFTELPNKVIYVYPNDNFKVTYEPKGKLKERLDGNLAQAAVDVATRILSRSEMEFNLKDETQQNFRDSHEYKKEINNIYVSIGNQLIDVRENTSKLYTTQIQLKSLTESLMKMQKDILKSLSAIKEQEV